MLPRPGSGPGDIPGVAAARIWRLPVRYRITLIVVQALLPGIAVSFFWVPVSGNHVLPAPLTWLILTAALATWTPLAARAWRESATLTPDLLVVRNVFRTRRIPLAAVTTVRIRGPRPFGQWAALTVSATQQPAHSAAPAATSSPVPPDPAPAASVLAPPVQARSAQVLPVPAPPAGRGGRHAGRHHGGRPVRIAAATLGGAQWTGRRVAADDLADAIAAAAGLPPLPPRKELISRRAARIMAPAGLALGVLGTVIKGGQAAGTFVSARALLGTMVWIAGFNLLWPALLAMLDRFCGRWASPPAAPAADGDPGLPVVR